MFNWILKGSIHLTRVCNLCFDGNLSTSNLLVIARKSFWQSDDIDRVLIFCSAKISLGTNASLQPNVLSRFASAYCKDSEPERSFMCWRRLHLKCSQWIGSIHKPLEVLSATSFGVSFYGRFVGISDLDSWGTILHSRDNLVLVQAMVIWSAVCNVEVWRQSV